MGRKPSRQTLRTRRLLQEALISLVQEQEFRSLRIQDITDRADLGRATFYMHYSDKEDLLAAVAEQGCIEIEAGLEKVGGRREFVGLKHALEQTRERPQLYQVVMGHQKSVERIRQFIIERAQQSKISLQEEFGFEPKYNNVVNAHFIAGAILGIFRWWLENPDELTPDELQNQFNEIITNGLINLSSGLLDPSMRDENE